MTASGNDIVFVLSGGSFNTDPNRSLGGNPSSQIVGSGLNNLFSSITETEAANGKTDFRCLYVFNQNPTDSLFSVRALVDSEVADGSSVEIGILTATEKQVIAIVNLVTGGSFTLTYEAQNVTVNFDPDLAVWTSNLQNALNTIPDFNNGINIQTIQTLNQVAFVVSFEGNGDNKAYSLLSLFANNLTGLSPTITITRQQNGSPINSIPTILDSELVIPNGVNFDTYDSVTPLLIGALAGTEGFPLWIRRVTPIDVSPQANDGFVLKILANPF
jgi:hypothetical protein